MGAPESIDGGRSLARAGIVVLGGYGLARALGWLRVVVIGTTFGAGPQLDAFYAAFRFPDLVFNLVATGALTAALVPPIAALLARGRPEQAWRVASSVSILVAIASAIFGVVLLVGAPALVPLLAPGFGPERTDLTIELTRIMAIGPLLLAVGAVVTSVLNATGRFAASMAAPIAYNVVTITAAIVLPPFIGVRGLAVGVVLGAAAFLLVQLVPLRRSGFRFTRRVSIREPEEREAAVNLLPRAFGLGVGQLQLIVATVLASGLAAGSVAAFAIAYTVYQIPVGTIGVPLGVVALPALTARYARGETTEYASLLVKTVRLMLYVMLPMTGIAIVMRTELVTILFNYGKFDTRAVALTSDALLFLLPGLAADGLNVLLARAVYARGGTWPPVVSGMTELAITVVVGASLVGAWGLSGIALAFSLGAWAETLLLLGAVLAATRAVDVGSLARGAVTFVVAAACATGAAWLAERALYTAGLDAGKLAALVQLVVAGTAGVATYAAISLALRIPELPDTLRLAVGAIRREPPVAA
jgi:putative peptidoglycan lipid II flippase